MPRWPLSTALLWGACLVSSTEHLAAGVLVDVGDEEGTSAGIFEPDELEGWLRSISIPVPSNLSSLVDGGNCSGLQIGDVIATDIGTPTAPELSYDVSGIGLQCTVKISDGGVTVDVALSNSKFYLRASVQPTWSTGGELFLPVGKIKVTGCDLQLNIAKLDFAGNTWLEDERTEIVSQVQAKLPGLICDGLTDGLAALVDGHQGELSAAADKVALAGKGGPERTGNDDLLQTAAEGWGGDGDGDGEDGSPTSNRTTKDGEPLVDWGAYPMLPFARALMAERGGLIIPAAVGTGTFELLLPEGLASWNGSEPTLPLSWKLDIVSLQLEGLNSLQSEKMVLAGKAGQLDVAVNLSELRVGVTLGLGLETPSAGTYSGRMNLSLGLENISLALRMLAAVSRPKLDGLYADQWQEPQCLAGCTSGTPADNDRSGKAAVSLSRLDPSLGVQNLAVASGGDLAADLASAAGTTGRALLSSVLSSKEALVAGTMALAREKLNQDIGKYLQEAPPCLGTKVYRGPGSDFCNALLCISFGLPVCAVIATWAVRGKRWFGADFEKHVGYSRNAAQIEALQGPHPHLGTHPVVPALLSNVYPFFAFGIMGMFLYSGLKPGIEVTLFVNDGRSEVGIGPAYSFSLINSFINACKAGSPLLAFVIIMFSGIWPLAKLALLIVAWLLPEAKLSAKSRGRLLHFLDDYGKYSLVDSWLAIMGDACYQIRWYSKETDVQMRLEALCSFPFFCFIMATVLSLGLGLVASEYHRQAEEWNKKASGELEDDALEHEDTGRTDAEGARPLSAYAGRRASMAVTLGLVLTVVVTIGAVYVDSFAVVLSGLFATVMLDEEGWVRPLSTATLAAGITKEVSTATVTLQAVFIISAILFPMVLLGALAVLWLVPLQRKTQDALLRTCRGLYAWASLEVFAMAVLVSHFTYATVARYMTYYDALENLCGAVKGYLRVDCLEINYEVLPGFSVLAVAGVLWVAMPSLVANTCQLALERRELGGSLLSETLTTMAAPCLAERDSSDGESLLDEDESDGWKRMPR